MKLLMRFYDVNGGSIKIDGNDIRTMSRHGLRNNIAMVLPGLAWLYSDTIMENIRYGNQDASDEEVIAAAKAAGQIDSSKLSLAGYNMVFKRRCNQHIRRTEAASNHRESILANRSF